MRPIAIDEDARRRLPQRRGEGEEGEQEAELGETGVEFDEQDGKERRQGELQEMARIMRHAHQPDDPRVALHLSRLPKPPGEIWSADDAAQSKTRRRRLNVTTGQGETDPSGVEKCAWAT